MNLSLKIIATQVHLLEYYMSLKETNDSGLDLVSPCDITIPPETTSFKVGLSVCCEPHFEDGKPRGYLLMPRSSMGKTTLRFSNSIGLIDYSYRGEISMMLDNIGKEPVTILQGSRICQLVSPDLSPIKITVVDELSETTRGSGGFGSTGV